MRRLALLCLTFAFAGPAAADYRAPPGGAGYLQLARESGDDAEIGILTGGYKFRGGWGELALGGGLLVDLRDYGPDGFDDDGDGDPNDDDNDLHGASLRFGLGYAAPWRVAPFVDLNVDLVDALAGDLFSAGEDEANYDFAFGMRLRFSDHWSMKAYRRTFRIRNGELFDLGPSVNERVHLGGVALDWDF